jgi:tetratricopeptide (TPR) repeat protein
MVPFDFVSELQQVINPADAPRVIAALRQDALVWAGLQQGDFFKHALRFAGGNLDRWRPGSLAVMAVDPDLVPEDLVVEPMQGIDGDLQQRSFQLFEELLRTGRLPGSLVEAGLLALALRERRRLTQTWYGLVHDLTPRVAGEEIAFGALWASPITCLFSLVPDGMELLKALQPWQHANPMERLTIQAILANVFDPAEQEVCFLNLLRDEPSVDQVGWLKAIHLYAGAEMAAHLSDQLLSQPPAGMKGLPGEDLPDKNDIEIQVSRALENQRKAMMHRIAGRPGRTIELLQSAQKTARLWLAELNTHLVEVAQLDNREDLVESALEQVAKNLPEDTALQANLASVAVERAKTGRAEAKSVIDQIPAESLTPQFHLEQAKWLEANDQHDEALSRAHQAVNNLLFQVSESKSLLPIQTGLSWRPVESVQILEQLGMQAEALQYALLALQLRPSDVELLTITSKLLIQLGDTQQAILYLDLVASLQPDSIQVHRRLAELWEEVSVWENACRERSRVIQMGVGVELADWAYLARAAYYSRRFELVVEACQELIKQEPENGQANLWMGQSLAEQGQMEEAVPYLKQATILLPEEYGPWLMLSEYYRQNNQEQRRLEILQLAALAVPGSAQINFELAQIFLERNMVSEALPYLQQAVHMDPANPAAALKLGQILLQLGHLTDARQALQQAHQRWPKDPELAVCYSQVLVELGETEEAVLPLSMAVESEEPKVEWLIAYANLLLGDSLSARFEKPRIQTSRVETARAVLENALGLEGENIEARLMMAEIRAAQDEDDEAYQIYQTLVDRLEQDNPQWYWRCQAGFGRVALKLGEVGTALAALQNAVQIHPEVVYLRRLLVDAYVMANLREEALQNARISLKQAPEDLDNLYWFSNIMLRLNEDEDAIEAMESITELAPTSPEIWLQLAGLQLRVGDLGAVKQTLDQLLALEGLTEGHLRQIAYTFMRIEDQAAALSCLEHAIQLTTNPVVDLLFEVACLHHRMGDLPAALDVLQRAIFSNPDEACLYVFQADLLVTVTRPQAALSSLEHALRLFEAQGEGCPWNVRSVAGFMPAWWIESILTVAGVHTRFAYLLRQAGDLTASLAHAEKALERLSSDQLLQYLTAELSIGLLQTSQVLAAVNEQQDSLEVSDGVVKGREELFVALQALRAELALEAGDENRAGELVQRAAQAGALSLSGQCRLAAIRARVLVRQGFAAKAKESLSQAMGFYQQMLKAGSKKAYYGLGHNDDYSFGRELWLGNAALELQQWDQAVELYEKYIQANPQHALAQLQIARTLVLAAERQRLCEALYCVTNSPGVNKTSLFNLSKVELVLTSAMRLSNSPEIIRWQARARAVFEPVAANVRGLIGLTGSAEDTAALAAILRQLKNNTGAIQVAQRYPDAPVVLAQLALSYLEEGSAKGLDYARQAQAAAPAEPLYHALYAMLAEKNQEISQALTAIEKALEFWPDEPAWHAWAAHYAAQTEAQDKMLLHWEKAFCLRPDSVQYANALGQAYLICRAYDKAIDILEKASALDSTCKDTWLNLAQANRQAGRLERALQAAEKAHLLAPHSAQIALMCGELALEQGRIEQAYTFAREAYEISPTEDEIVLFLGQVMVQQGQYANALALFEQTLQNGKASPTIGLERAKLVRKLHGSKSALPVWQELARQQPQDPQVLAQLAQTQADNGDFEAAEATAEVALRLNPDMAELSLLMGKLQRASGQLDAAIRYLSDAIRMDAHLLDAYLELGKTYYERREYLQALRIYQQAMRLVPDNPQIYFEAAMALKDNKDFLGAEKMLRRASELSPNDLNIRRQLGAVTALNLVHSSQEASSFL